MPHCNSDHWQKYSAVSEVVRCLEWTPNGMPSSALLKPCTGNVNNSGTHKKRPDTTTVAAARLVTGAKRSGHIMPVLQDRHWLLIRPRITFKTAVLVYKCQHGTTQQYLQAYCKPMSARSSHRLRSVSSSVFWLLIHPNKLRRS